MELSTSRPIDGSSGSDTTFMDGVSVAPENFVDIGSDTFASYFSDWDPNSPPKVLFTTSPKATKATPKLFWELVGVFPRPNFSRGRRSEGSRWTGLQGRPQTEDAKKSSE